MKHNQQSYTLEIELAEGLEDAAVDELQVSFASEVRILSIERGEIRIQFTGDLQTLRQLRIPTAVYLYRAYDVPRPKALLGHQNFHVMLADIKTVIDQSSDTFGSFHISAAGSDSSVMERIKTELASATKLRNAEDSGDLLIRIRRSKTDWEVLTRLTARPLSTRDWRVCDFEAALNAPLAAAMIAETHPQPTDRFLNLMCGSGTLLIERMPSSSNELVIGCDSDDTVLRCAEKNIHAANYQNIALLCCDAKRLPFDSSMFNVLCADLPFGQRVGSHEHNKTLYPAILKEAARISTDSARFVLITHEIRLIEQVIAQSPLWMIEKTYRVSQRGYLPGVYVLRKP